MSNLGFTRADLVNAQDYGSPAAYQLGHGTNKAASPQEDDPIPLHNSVEQVLQVILLFSFGQVYRANILDRIKYRIYPFGDPFDIPKDHAFL